MQSLLLMLSFLEGMGDNHLIIMQHFTIITDMHTPIKSQYETEIVIKLKSTHRIQPPLRLIVSCTGNNISTSYAFEMPLPAIVLLLLLAVVSLLLLGRIAALARFGLLVQTSVGQFVYLSITPWAYKSSWTNHDAIRDVDSVASKEPCIRLGPDCPMWMSNFEGDDISISAQTAHAANPRAVSWHLTGWPQKHSSVTLNFSTEKYPCNVASRQNSFTACCYFILSEL